MANQRAERDKERPPLGIGFAIMLAILLSLPLWGGIIWLAQLAWDVLGQ